MYAAELQTGIKNAQRAECVAKDGRKINRFGFCKRRKPALLNYYVEK